MLFNRIEKLILSMLLIAGFAAFGFWIWHDPVKHFSISLPGLDNRPASDISEMEDIEIGEEFILYNSPPETATLSGKWPRFRGADSDNINKENISLIDSWGKSAPVILWEMPLGEGYAAPAIYNGLGYLLDYDEQNKADVLICFDIVTGDILWKRWYYVNVRRNHGMSRTVPAVNEKYVVTIGPRGQVMCADRLTGEFIWGLDMVRSYNAEIPFWYTGQCPLIHDNTVVLATGGDALLIGVKCATGEVVWETPNPLKWQMSHSSIMPMKYKGKTMYIYAAVGGICGISAERQDKGQILWSTTDFAPAVVAPSPVVFEDGRIFITAGYGAGSATFQLLEQNGEYTIVTTGKYRPREGLASEQQTPVVINDRMFGVLPKDAGNFRNQFVCSPANDVKSFIWTSGKTTRFGLGPYIFADDKFFILDDDGTLFITRPLENELQILDKKRIIEGQDAWGPIAIADGYLLMRDSKKMVCLDIKKRN
jgi:outer membrane protein assembly factor BamB